MNKKKIFRFFKNNSVGFGLTIASIIIVSLFHFLGAFDVLELKTYDYRFSTVRGPSTGWRASDSTWIKRGTDVVLVEVDDEAWRLMPEAWPYPRGTIWSHVIDNLSRAGAKVIGFDIQFDSPETKSDYLYQFANNIQSQELRELIPEHGDVVLGRTIAEARERGTTVIISSKMVNEPNRVPPQYIAKPVPEIMAGKPQTGLINDMLDQDGFSRQYNIFNFLKHEPDKFFLTFGIKSVMAFSDIPDTTKPRFFPKRQILQYGPYSIRSYGISNNFLVNYYGPPSGYRLRTADENLPPWGTFPRYSLAYIIDTEDIHLRDPEEDIDWMDQFLPGDIPEWIQAIEDPQERQEMIDLMGVGEAFDVTQTPFYNKIVIIGVAVEVLHDVKSTPFYNYLDRQQLTPGMETHANAIQTILHNNYLKVVGGRLTKLLYDYPWSHTWLIALLSVLALLILLLANPIVAGFLILVEGILYFAAVSGLFVNDVFWLFREFLSAIFPDNYVANHTGFFQTPLPGPGKSVVVPLVAPLAGMVLTYTSIVIYRYINEQKDKKFLKSTFGTYISPDLIDQMYEEKQEPKLGGEAGYHTAFFSDIQSFSSFSEVLEPDKMVALMNEYLTEMTNVLLKHQGTLDKYIGDAIVAFWGAPVPVDGHEIKSCYAALDMAKRLDELREKWRNEEDWPDIVHNMQHRVGLNSGDMVTGNMGSTMRMNYTMMGDTVNLAARLESSAKQYGVYIQVAENTYKGAKDLFEWRFLDYVKVKGKTIPVKVYELLGEKGKVDDNTLKLLKTFHEAQDHYLKQELDKAIQGFKEAEKLEDMFPGRNSNPSVMYINRCELMKENPPGEDWDGVWTLTAK